ncbi:hypothetical protein PSI9734_00779 [Pseudidiomarina piscicola]|uniref:DUF2884 domain-containing protein n=1 Tax=Pseudidiomarina piscicola TaxID=2614830 RepID=A0A6S6WNC2_9GAMM|nr:hypothetical protein [Pseudidiomarina piscicola]CAB0150218.1 hypothetical protein PSI9734_00779 [Pseudidiomarina piscicola]VZT39653.1 hypothetical protein PSI9734_00779 [Pseudomonas aeruginosa]
MKEKRKVWLAVSAAVLGSSVVHADGIDTNAPHPHTMSVVAPFEGGGGEGEGEGSGSVDLRTNDSAYLAHLGLIRGHLYVGKKLYDEGHLTMAKTHMKHPEDELYAALIPAFTARQVPGFGAKLSNLADAVNGELGEAAVNAAYKDLMTAITTAEAVTEKSVKAVLMSLSTMLLTAAEEYDLGVEQGTVVNVHEFQDAYGFTQIAHARINELSAAQREQNSDAIAEVEALLKDLPNLWPTITPEGVVEGDSSTLYATAARIELATLN